MSIYLNTIFLLLYFLYSYYFFASLKGKSILFFLLYFNQFWLIISSYTLDFGGIYHYELNFVSMPSLSTLFLIVSNILFFQTLLISFKKKKVLLSGQYGINNFYIRIIAFVTTVIIAMLYLSIIKTGIPVLSSVDRATVYQELLQIPFLGFIVTHINSLIMFIGLAYSIKVNKNEKNYIFLILFLLLFLYLILIGNKYSALILFLVYFLVPIVMTTNRSFVSGKNLIYIGVIFLFIVLGTSLLHAQKYSYINNIGGGLLGDYLFQRIFVLQGGIWHKTFDLIVYQGQYDLNHFFVEVKNILGLQSSKYTGLKHLMVFTTKGDFIFKVIRGEYLYTGGFPAILLATFNWMLYFPVFYLLARFYVFIINNLYRAVVSKNMLILYISFGLYISYNTMLITGDFDSFFSIATLVKMIILFFLIYSVPFISKVRFRRLSKNVF